MSRYPLRCRKLETESGLTVTLKSYPCCEAQVKLLREFSENGSSSACCLMLHLAMKHLRDGAILPPDLHDYLVDSLHKLQPVKNKSIPEVFGLKKRKAGYGKFPNILKYYFLYESGKYTREDAAHEVNPKELTLLRELNRYRDDSSHAKKLVEDLKNNLLSLMVDAGGPDKVQSKDISACMANTTIRYPFMICLMMENEWDLTEDQNNQLQEAITIDQHAPEIEWPIVNWPSKS